MLNKYEIDLLHHLVDKELREDACKFDTEAEIDTSLSYFENKNIILKKIDLFREKDPLKNLTKKEILEDLKDEPETAVKRWIKKVINKSYVYAIISKRGGGKSCLGFSMLEWHKLSGRKCFIYKFPKEKLLPKWITNVDDIIKADKGGVLLIDEGGIEFNQFSFNSKKSVELSNMLKVARHRDLSIIFIAQNGATLTRDIRRMIDCYLLREPSFTQLYDEISVIKRMYQNCFVLFAPKEAKLKGFFITEIGEMGYFDKPEWFTDGISKAYDGDKETFNVSKFFSKKKAKV